MVGKNNRQLQKEKYSNKFKRYSLKKLSVGLASVTVATGLFFATSTEASAQEATVVEEANAQETGVAEEDADPEASENEVANEEATQTDSQEVSDIEPASTETEEDANPVVTEPETVIEKNNQEVSETEAVETENPTEQVSENTDSTVNETEEIEEEEVTPEEAEQTTPSEIEEQTTDQQVETTDDVQTTNQTVEQIETPENQNQDQSNQRVEPHDTLYIENSELPFEETQVAQEGQDGLVESTPTDKTDADGNPINEERYIQSPREEVVEKGNIERTTEAIPHTTEYAADSELPFQEREVVQQGEDGSRDLLNIHSVDPQTGDLTPLFDGIVDLNSIKDPQTEVVNVGNVETVREVEEHSTVYSQNPDLPFAEQNVAREGQDEVTVSENTYQVDSEGNLVNPVETDRYIETPRVDEHIQVGNIERNKEVLDEFETEYLANAELDFRGQQIVQEGRDASRDTLTIHQVDAQTGELTPLYGGLVDLNSIVDRQDRIIEIGNREVAVEEIPFETIRRDNEELALGEEIVVQEGEDGKITRTTVYSVDPSTGELVDPVVSEDINEAVNQIVEVGTREEPSDEPGTNKLIFSEYIEGSSNNKAYELANLTDNQLDLTGYTVELYSNGNTSANTTYELSGVLEAGEVHVVANSQASSELLTEADLTNGTTAYNGDDALVLKYQGEIVDSIGQISGRENLLQDVTLVRQADRLTGDTNTEDGFDAERDGWEVFAQDTFEDLGQHDFVVPQELNETVLFSQIVEGSSNNKAIELFNGTGEAVDLSEFTIELYSNSNTNTQSTYTPTGTLENGQYYVVAHTSASQALQAQADDLHGGVTAFNGDDTLVLRHNGTVIDSFGQVGIQEDRNENATLIRNSDVTVGDTDPTNPFDPTLEWTALPQDTFEFLGNDADNPGEEDPVEEEETELEHVSVATARQGNVGDRVLTSGVVTGLLNNTAHFEDETAGLALYPGDSVNISVGDRIVVVGELAEYNNLLQLQNPEIIEVTAGEVPSPTPMTGNDLNEQNESKLGVLSNVSITGIDGEGSSWANYTAEADGTSFLLRDENKELGLEIGATYDQIAGIVQQYGEDYQILPRDTFDVVFDETVTRAPVSSISQTTIPAGTEVELVSQTDGATIYYTTDGSVPTTDSAVYTEPITLTEDVLIQAFAQGESLEASPVVSFEYDVYDPEVGLQIHHLQGEGHYSDFVGTYVEDINGIVTATYDIGSSSYAHIQTPDSQVDDNPNTSEAIVLYLGGQSYAPNLAVGNYVSVSGTVDEYQIEGFYSSKEEDDLPVTQINARDDRGGVVTVLEESVPLPAPIYVTDIPEEVSAGDDFATFNPELYALDFWEAIEGMYVALPYTVRAVSPQEHGDLWVVNDANPGDTAFGGLLLREDDVNTEKIGIKPQPNRGNNGFNGRNFDVLTGDRFEASEEDPITGVVMYDFSHYKIYTPLEEMVSRIDRSDRAVPDTATDIIPQEEKLTIAAYNLENYSNSPETSEEKAQRLANAIGIVMKTPDIVGLTEVQDNNGSDAGGTAGDESYQRLINDIYELTGVRYEYANIDPIAGQDGGAPNANIRVGFLYNPDRVQMTPGIPAGDATTPVGYEDGNLTLNPGRINPNTPAFESSRKPLAAQFDFNGEQVIVIVNHWNSKGGDDPIYGSTQEPVLESVDQRVAIANEVADFVEGIKAENPDANIVSVGDFNDFQWTEPLQIHEGDHMTNMVNHVPEEERYSYNYNGNMQTLDHILVSNNLVDDTVIDMVKINADFTDFSGRASDHDPLIVQIDFSEEEEVLAEETPGENDGSGEKIPVEENPEDETPVEEETSEEEIPSEETPVERPRWRNPISNFQSLISRGRNMVQTIQRNTRLLTQRITSMLRRPLNLFSSFRNLLPW